MAEERNRTTPFLVSIIVVLVAILAFVLGRASAGDRMGWFGHDPRMGGGMMNDDGMRGGMMHSGSGDLSGADVMFLQMMIPHHQQAVDMADMAIARSANTELLVIARAIKVGQTAEIEQMRKWLADNGVREGVGHHMNMGSMLSDAEMADLDAASGDTFDQLWLAGMISHHEGALHMITMIDDSANPEMRAFAAAIDVTQTREIGEMRALLT